MQEKQAIIRDLSITIPTKFESKEEYMATLKKLLDMEGEIESLSIEMIAE